MDRRCLRRQLLILTDQPVVFRSELLLRHLRPGILVDKNLGIWNVRKTGTISQMTAARHISNIWR